MINKIQTALFLIAEAFAFCGLFMVFLGWCIAPILAIIGLVMVVISAVLAIVMLVILFVVVLMEVIG